ncbi:MAG: alpha-glucosidase [Clostridia bacterium]|nr:alpha-glucosidase [Clostridia bacterium]
MLKTDKERIFYQIYPKSFCDSNGDGVGDFRGIISKIPYLKELGINSVWISPFFESPGVDSGYDISDYRAIDPQIGTMDDFEEMVSCFHENGIDAILDFVANHTSTEHVWFKESEKSKDNPFRNYYIWRKTPPNEWESTFGGSAWEYDEKTGEYYLRSFAKEQADLNWENPKVRQEMQAVVDFWLEKGVNGFRCDVLDLISKDFSSPINGSGPQLHPYIRELFGRENCKNIFTVGECWSATKENAQLFCDKNRKELTTVFAFQHLCLDNGRFYIEKPSLKTVCERMSKWQKVMADIGAPATVFLENHDQARSVSRFADDTKYRFESATALGGLLLLHDGVPFLYQGQEIGFTNSYHTDISEFDDAETLGYYGIEHGKTDERSLMEKINFGSRDNPRHMIAWTAETQEAWIAPYSRQKEINVEKDLSSEKSVYAFYQSLIALRKKEKCFTEGEFQDVELTDGYYVFKRALGEKEFFIVFAFGKECVAPKIQNAKVVLNNYNDVGKMLQPYQLIVYQKKGKREDEK